MRDDFLWVEKYRPRTIDKAVLPAELSSTFSEFVSKGNIPNMLLSGGPGMGKTTVARAMLEELGCDYIVINGSMNGNIDTLRNDIRNFASTVSFNGGRKYVILDEADYLNPQSTQPALRNFMEEFSNNCGFILTCNFANRIISPLHSRCSVIEFKIPNSEKPKLAAQLMKRIHGILSQEHIEYEEKVVAEVIMKHFPDFRRVLNELQRYSATGKIDTGILVNLHDVSMKSLMQHMKEKNFKEVRKWVVENIDNDPVMMYRKLYDTATEYFKPESVPSLVLIIADYSYKSAFVADQEVNLVACLTEIMSECHFA
jgi:DNA polymerase III delta prime subunit